MEIKYPLTGFTLAQAKKNKSASKPLALSVHANRALQEGIFYVLVAIAALLILALLTYNHSDPGWNNQGMSDKISNWGGVLGAGFADVTLSLFGYMAYLWPVMVAYSGWLLLKSKQEEEQEKHVFIIRWAGFILLLISGSGLGSFSSVSEFALPQAQLGAGGILGDTVGMHGLRHILGTIGTKLVLLAVFCASITLFTGISWLRIMDKCGEGIMFAWAYVVMKASGWIEEFKLRKVKTERAEKFVAETQPKIAKIKTKKPRIEPTIKKVEQSQRVFKEKQINLFDTPSDTQLPPINLLDLPKVHEGGYSEDALQAYAF